MTLLSAMPVSANRANARGHKRRFSLITSARNRITKTRKYENTKEGEYKRTDYAALVDPSIKQVIIVDPPKSHRGGPIFLNVLRVLEIPEALGLVAPRRLTLLNANEKAFDRTAEIYRLAGAADRLQQK